LKDRDLRFKTTRRGDPEGIVGIYNSSKKKKIQEKRKEEKLLGSAHKKATAGFGGS